MSRYGMSVMASVFFMAAASGFLASVPEPRGEELLIIAHRGASGYAPENTLAAFTLALELGADMLELDIRCSADGELVVIHDDRVERTTNGSGFVRDMTLAELKELDAGYNFSPDRQTFPFRGQGLTIPTLLEVLEAFPQIPLLIDIKELETAGAKALQRLIANAGAEGRIILSSFNDRTMGTIRSLNSGLPLAAANRQIAAFFAASRLGMAGWLVTEYRVLSIPPSRGIFRLANPVLVRSAQRLGLRVWVWTINEPGQVEHYSALGVDGIITDFPDQVRQQLSARRK